jgi:hypothetical protein
MSVHRPSIAVFWTVVITRNFYLTLLLAACILGSGGFLFRDSEAGSFATVIVAFGVGLGLLEILDDRDRRRKQSSG